MAVEDATDRAGFFDPADFGVTATYNGTTSVNGIFDNAYFEVAAGEAGIQSTHPVFWCRTADIPSPTHNQTLIISSVTYKIVGVEPDSTGITQLMLEKQ